MKTPKKTLDLIRQNEQVVKKSQKHDANLQKNSVLFFQVGLIVCFLAAYGLLEMNFEKTDDIVTAYPRMDDNDLYVFHDPVKVYEEEVKKELVKKIPNSFKEPTISDDPTIEVISEIFTEPPVIDKPISPGDIKVDVVPEDIPIHITFIEQVPIYPGCEKEKSNDAKRKCMSEKITKLVQKQFDTNLAGELGLTGKQVIRTQFKIDKTGHVTDIQIRAPHSKLKEEAERVLNQIPDMTPGRQQNKNVGVIYSLPIVFQVQN
ncbi:energy transducer TonB [Confluentibacter flavum]|uniref:Energy transducer TonB n=1 Tax=Confluentibacter flavum TaxID=1909700 RepID=A0A2N3HHE4_9FLAO|nr:energy transducer TonB [Confluentibacter flavum]PKQ44376.1 energy transducer TonB [Confluentibacter flavum]